MNTPTTSDIAKWQLVTVKTQTSLLEAFRKMTHFRIRHLPVLDETEQLVGIISDRDVQRALNVEVWVGPGKTRIEDCQFDNYIVEDFMSWPVRTVSSSASVSEIAQLMVKEKISFVMIFDEENRIGIVTHEDLLTVLIDLLSKNDSPKPKLKDKIESWIYESPLQNIAGELSNTGI